MALSNSVGNRPTEFGGGVGHPQRKPDGTPQALDPQEMRRAFMAAGWDEVRGDVDRAVGVPVRPDWVPRHEPNPSETANGYADPVNIPTLSEGVAGRAGS